MFKHILLPVDGSELSHKAVSAAIQFARTDAARLTPLHVRGDLPFRQTCSFLLKQEQS